MSQPFKHLDELIFKYLDADCTDEEFAELQALLLEDASYRQRYQLLVEVHHGIAVRSALGEKAKVLPFTTDAAPKKVFPFSNWLGVAAMVALLCVVTWSFIFNDGLDVKLTAARDTDWRGAELDVGEYASHRMMRLMRGAVVFGFPGKTTAIIEGPALFQIQDNQTIELSSGTITVHHEGKPGDFRVITPVGVFTDLGTKFGVQVGNGVTDSMVMAEVYEGEVVFGNDQDSHLSLTDGDAYAFVGNNKHQEIHSELEGRVVKVHGTFELSESQDSLVLTSNLALGKPVSSPSSYMHPKHGEVFPASALTDGRLNDTGSPWNWSFWLAVNQQAGEFTLDLEEMVQFSRIELMNTRNRHHGDRGMKAFSVEVSENGEDFVPLFTGELEAVSSHEEQGYQFEAFRFDPVSARYVKLIGHSYYSSHEEELSCGGGLNEIRIFE